MCNNNRQARYLVRRERHRARASKAAGARPNASRDRARSLRDGRSGDRDCVLSKSIGVRQSRAQTAAGQGSVSQTGEGRGRSVSAAQRRDVLEEFQEHADHGSQARKGDRTLHAEPVQRVPQRRGGARASSIDLKAAAGAAHGRTRHTHTHTSSLGRGSYARLLQMAMTPHAFCFLHTSEGLGELFSPSPAARFLVGCCCTK